MPRARACTVWRARRISCRMAISCIFWLRDELLCVWLAAAKELSFQPCEWGDEKVILTVRDDPCQPGQGSSFMRCILPLIVLLSLGFAPAPVPKAKPDTTVQDLKALQGTWHRSSMRVGGRL